MAVRGIKSGDHVTPKWRITGQLLSFDPGVELIVIKVYGVHCTLYTPDGGDSIVGVPLDILRKLEK